MKVVLVNYGAGNIKSLQFALERLGVDGILSSDVAEIQEADKVIFPGVGEASSAMMKLKESGLDLVIPKLEQPVLGICLGMQLASVEFTTIYSCIFGQNTHKYTPVCSKIWVGWV